MTRIAVPGSLRILLVRRRRGFQVSPHDVPDRGTGGARAGHRVPDDRFEDRDPADSKHGTHHGDYGNLPPRQTAPSHRRPRTGAVVGGRGPGGGGRVNDTNLSTDLSQRVTIDRRRRGDDERTDQSSDDRAGHPEGGGRKSGGRRGQGTAEDLGAAQTKRPTCSRFASLLDFGVWLGGGTSGGRRWCQLHKNLNSLEARGRLVRTVAVAESSIHHSRTRSQHRFAALTHQRDPRPFAGCDLCSYPVRVATPDSWLC